MKTFDSINIGGAIVTVLVMMFVMLQKSETTHVDLDTNHASIEYTNEDADDKSKYDHIRP